MNEPVTRRNIQSPVRVLIVDDSALIRSALSRFFKAEGLEVVGAAADPFAARDMIVELKPDILTLDLEMPRMDGLTFLERLMRHQPMPVVVLSSFTEKGSAAAIRALELGAVEVLEKPTREKFGPLMVHLLRVLKEAGRARVRRKFLAKSLPAEKKQVPSRPSKVVAALGASTGGTDALCEILTALPIDHPGLVVVQHMPALFTKYFAARLDRYCSIQVREAKDGDIIMDGLALIAPGNLHMTVDWAGGKYHVNCQEGPMVHHCRPSVDVLFHSVARTSGPDAVGVILTGMGEDGAGGLLALREAGAATLAQDEASCVVYGMPKEAVARGAVDEVVPLQMMADVLQTRIKRLVLRKEGGSHGNN